MPIGVKQMLLLKMCETRGYLINKDVAKVYEIKYHDGLQLERKTSAKINILIVYGYLEQEGLTRGRYPRKKYVLTESGENKIKEWEIKHMNNIKKTEKKCVQCEAIFFLDPEILWTFRRLDSIMHGSKAWWKRYQDLCDKCFEKIYQGVTTPDVSIIDEIETHPEYKKWLKDFSIHSIAQLKEMGKRCKTAK